MQLHLSLHLRSSSVILPALLQYDIGMSMETSHFFFISFKQFVGDVVTPACHQTPDLEDS